MTQAFDVCIRGAGVVGQTLALLLARERLRVALVAPPRPADAAPPAADVRAYALNSASQKLLASLRCWPESDAATPVTDMRVYGDQGGSVHFSAQAQQTEALTWIVDVPALEARLADAVGFQPQIERVDSPQNAALTVVCEGRASRTREEFGVNYQTTPYPHTAIAARLELPAPHQQCAQQWFLPGQVMAFLPISGPQGNSVALVWSVPHHEVPELMSLSPADFANRVAAGAGLPADSLRLSSERASWPLQQSRADHWTGTVPTPEGQAAPQTTRRWALAGDAAHAVHPLAGQGLNLGLGDVAALARILRERDYWRSVSDPKLLRRYERERKAGIWALGLASDGLQWLFDHPLTPLPTARNWGMNQFDRSGPLKNWVTRLAMGLN
ncbi:FAD-dependent monooxygenase [Curvibacter sp. HBC61]|uniref:FAD-dependent monooxygenase n=1 Tax=Curvibacter cyanobacteriorum TaxID=3026422 RepID=A0ABT5N2F5_9BURK|nr:FAD-dependent monooxygenase [Curvibacter sp. HBC61]MDD0839769.1 FAD-dependent monooxygenase [Curvibacter sp. HBC61]